METMRALSITMLCAFCGLHAADDGKSYVSTNVGTFKLIEDYRGIRSGGESSDEIEKTPNNEHQEKVQEKIDEFFAGFEMYLVKPEQDEEEKPEQIEIHKTVEQQERGLVIEKKRSMFPTIMSVGAVVGVGCAVYKYLTAKKDTKKEEVEKQSKVENSGQFDN